MKDEWKNKHKVHTEQVFFHVLVGPVGLPSCLSATGQTVTFTARDGKCRILTIARISHPKYSDSDKQTPPFLPFLCQISVFDEPVSFAQLWPGSHPAFWALHPTFREVCEHVSTFQEKKKGSTDAAVSGENHSDIL